QAPSATHEASLPLAVEDDWPDLSLSSWAATRDTLHMYTQVVGKVRLALSPMEPQWGQVPLYVTARGLTTSPISYLGRSFAITFDLIAHELDIELADGETRTFSLGQSVAAFYEETLRSLRSLGIDVAYRPRPTEVPHPVAF